MAIRKSGKGTSVPPSGGASAGGGAEQPPIEPQVLSSISMADAPLVLAEYNSMVDIAMRYPRNLEKALEAAIADIENPHARDRAASNWYSIPYKNHEKGCTDRKNCECPSKPVEGLSVKCAYGSLRHYKNLATKCTVLRETEDAIYLSGMARDLESNTFVERPRVVHKKRSFKRQNQTVFYIIGDAELTKAFGAEASKSIRDAILNQFPEWWKKALWEACRRVNDEYENAKAGGKDKAQAGLVSQFAKLKVTQEMLEKKLGHRVKDSTDEERLTLRGWYNALEQGESTIEEIFGGATEKHETTTEEFTKGQASSEEVKEKPAAEQKKEPAPEKPPDPAAPPKKKLF